MYRPFIGHFLLLYDLDVAALYKYLYVCIMLLGVAFSLFFFPCYFLPFLALFIKAKPVQAIQAFALSELGKVHGFPMD